MMKLLLVSHGLPFPPSDGVRERAYNIAVHLQEEVPVDICCLVKDKKELERLPQFSAHFHGQLFPVLVQRNIFYKLKILFLTLFSRKPMVLHFYFSKRMRQRINDLLKSNHYQWVQFERSFMAQYLEDIFNGQNTKTAINLYDFETVRAYRIYKSIRNPIKSLFQYIKYQKLKRYELDVFRKADYLFAISKDEKEQILSYAPELSSKLHILTGGVDVHYFRYFEELPNERNIVFVGSPMVFNYEALDFFYHEIFKKLKAVTFHVIGNFDKKQIGYLVQDSNVIVHGYVEDIRPIFGKCAVSVVPLKNGSGTRLKILDSMAMGRSVISTSIGCEGLQLTNDYHIMIRNEPNSFAEAIDYLLSSKNANDMMRRRAREYVEQHYSWEKVVEGLRSFYLSTLPSPQSKVTRAYDV